MDRNIKIEIKDRVAHLVGNPKIICGNNDYSVTFTFDDEWTGVDVKTLRVSYNNKYSDHVFSGDTVELPPIIKAVEVYLGVFAGDITSTKVAVRAEPSILCEGGSVADPEPDVYNQIIDLLNSKEPSGGIAQESDPTVPAWAKEPNKPEYTAEEVGAASIEDVERLSEEIIEQLDGKQPKGDYALKSEIPTVPESYTLPTASAEVKGGVKIGEGLRMDGDVLGVVPEPELELIETIICDGTYGNLIRLNLALTHAKIYLHMQAAEDATAIGVEAKNDTGMFGYAWIGNGINTGERWIYVYLVSDGKEAYCENTSFATVSYGTGAIYKTANRFDASTPINRINIYASGGKMFPAGSTIEIWGVRA